MNNTNEGDNGLRIGNIEIQNRVVLAPMAGVTDKAFRIIARNHGCGLIYTEMISAKALTYKNIKTKALLDVEGEEQPIAVQLFGSDPEIMAEAAQIAVREGARIIDVNMGCPVPKVVRNSEGSALLAQPELAAEIVRAMVRAVDVPITVKMRIGLDRGNIVAVGFAQQVEAAGASAIAVHGRTRDQYYSGKADLDMIRKVKESVDIPVIGNGDVWTARDAKNLLDVTGADAVMLGRGVLGNPWLISNTLMLLEGHEIEELPTPEEKIRAALTHLELTILHKGEINGVQQMRKALAWYLKGLSRTAAVKEAIFHARTRVEVVKLLESYLSSLWENM